MAEPDSPEYDARAVTVRLADVTIPDAVDAGLTHSQVKRRLYAVDSYFRDSWEDLRQVAGEDAVSLASRHALLLLKPDAVVRRRLSGALEWLTARGWRVVHANRFRVNRWAVRALWQYQWNTATRDRRDIADLYMPATDSLVLLLRAPTVAEWACSTLTRVKGGSDPAGCRPGDLRYVLGTLNQQLNLVHSADEPADLVREIGVCWTAAERAEVYEGIAGGVDVAAKARSLAAELESEHARLDLSLSATVTGLLRRIDARTDGRDGARDLRRRLVGILADEPSAWRDVVALADQYGVPLSRWERVVLGTFLLVPTLDGVVPLVPDASRLLRTPAGQ